MSNPTWAAPALGGIPEYCVIALAMTQYSVYPIRSLVTYCRFAAIKNKNLGCGLRRQPALAFLQWNYLSMRAEVAGARGKGG
jgi:hypothetical protein